MAKRKATAPATASAGDSPLAPEPATPNPTTKLWLWIAAAVIAALFIVIYAMRLDRVVGMFQDDAWYVLLAKALATGQGYTLVNSPTSGILPLYPPAFPFLLSLVYRLAPQFPENLWLLKSISIVAMFVTGVVAFVYCTRYREMPKAVALAIAAGIVLHPGLAFMATGSVMSECAFTLAQMVAILAVERCAAARDDNRFWLYALLAAAATSWAFLTRSMAAGLILAALLYLAKERLFKHAAVFAVGVALFAGSWTLYSRAHAPTKEQRAEVNSYIVRPYNEQFWDRVAGNESAGSVTLGDLPARFWNNFSSIVGSDTGGVVLPSFFPALNQGLAERGNDTQWVVSLLAFALIVTGFVVAARQKLTYAEFALPLSLAIIIAWPFPPYRFLLPSLPLLLFYLVLGLKLLLSLHQRFAQTKTEANPWTGVTVAAGLVVALCLYGNVSYLQRKSAETPGQRPRWLRSFAENEAILKWTNENVPKTDAIATMNPALVHLYTGNKTTTFDNPTGNWQAWNQLGIRYLVYISPTRIADPDANENKYRVIHRAGGELNLRVTDFGPTAARAPWGAGLSPSTIRMN